MESMVMQRRQVSGYEVYRNTQGTVHLKLFVAGGAGERSYYLSQLETKQLAQQEPVVLAEEGSLLRARVVGTGQAYEIRDEKADGATYTYVLPLVDGDALAQDLVRALQR